MLIDTKYLGKLEIDPEKIITFDQGLPGFETERRFVLLDIAENEHIQILQSVQTDTLAFFVVNPYQFFSDYTIKITEPIIESLEIKNEQDVVILSIITLKDPFSSSTLNLKAPLIINWQNKRGKQYILNDDTYSMRTPIVNKRPEESGG